MTTAQYAELFHVHRASVVKMCQNQKISCKKIRVGKRMHWYVVLPRDVIEARILKNSEDIRARNVEKIRAEIAKHETAPNSASVTEGVVWAAVCAVVLITIIWMF